MKVARLLEERRSHWQELERLCQQLEQRRMGRVGPTTIGRFASLYRAACADLAMAEAYQLPQQTVQYLHQLVGRSHNQLYRSHTFSLRHWAHEMFRVVPRRLLRDRCLWLAFVVFWGFFLMAMFLAYSSREFAANLVGEELLSQMEIMHGDALGNTDGGLSGLSTGYYINHNTSIGLNCFAYGLLFGIGGLFVLIPNALVLGAVFGHMATTPHADNFFQFVTAHGPFELTAVVLSAAAGMRMGFALISTGGLTREAALHRASKEAMPIMGAAIVLFALAALIEGFLSPSAAPYWVKAAVAAASAGLMGFYFVALGLGADEDDATG